MGASHELKVMLGALSAGRRLQPIKLVVLLLIRQIGEPTSPRNDIE